MKRIYLIGLFFLTFGFSINIHAQALPAAKRLRAAQVGAGFSFAIPDYGGTYLKGFTGYADLDLFRRLALEFDAHFNSIFTPTDIGEDTFLIGPKFSIMRRGRAHIYVKGLGGIGRFHYQKGVYQTYTIPSIHTDTFGVFAIGGGIDFHASPHLNVRAIDVEAQDWPSYGTPGHPAHGLTPFVTTFGVGYVF